MCRQPTKNKKYNGRSKICWKKHRWWNVNDGTPSLWDFFSQVRLLLSYSGQRNIKGSPWSQREGLELKEVLERKTETQGERDRQYFFLFFQVITMADWMTYCEWAEYNRRLWDPLGGPLRGPNVDSFPNLLVPSYVNQCRVVSCAQTFVWLPRPFEFFWRSSASTVSWAFLGTLRVLLSNFNWRGDRVPVMTTDPSYSQSDWFTSRFRTHRSIPRQFYVKFS